MTTRDITLRTADDLVAAGIVDARDERALRDVADRYAVAITPAMARIIDRSDPADPIARQFVPDLRELSHAAGEVDDPIGDKAHTPVEGIVHRYRDRVLLKLVHVCPVYCRFCFRREMVGPMGPSALSPDAFAGALDYISSRPEIWEVILTGGDPLVLSPRRIAEVTAALAAVPHVKILRWHTRVPVVAPERVTADLAAALRTDDATTYVALHANHPRELSPEARTAIARIVDAGVPMISQTVLLRGINDDAATLEALMRGFVETRVKPYYLHHADLANGTAHLRTTLSDGQQLMDALRGRVSGLCQPTYVLDIPGGFGKVPVGPCYLSELSSADGVTCEVRDPDGRDHAYPPAINHQ